MQDKPFHVRDARASGRYYIDEELLQVYGAKIKVLGVAVYNALAMYTNNQTQECYPSIKTIADLLGLSTVSVGKAIKLLEKHGLIHITRQSRNEKGISDGPNIYTLLDIKGGTKIFSTPTKNVDTGSKEDLDGGTKNFTSNQTDSNQTDLTKERERAAKAAPVPRQIDTRAKHPAIQACREMLEQYPKKALWDEIISTVQDVEKWRLTMRAWIGRYSTPNIDGMLDWYRTGIPQWTGYRKVAASATYPASSRFTPIEQIKRERNSTRIYD